MAIIATVFNPENKVTSQFKFTGEVYDVGDFMKKHCTVPDADYVNKLIGNLITYGYADCGYTRFTFSE